MATKMIVIEAHMKSQNHEKEKERLATIVSGEKYIIQALKNFTMNFTLLVRHYLTQFMNME